MRAGSQFQAVAAMASKLAIILCLAVSVDAAAKSVSGVSAAVQASILAKHKTCREGANSDYGWKVPVDLKWSAELAAYAQAYIGAIGDSANIMQHLRHSTNDQLCSIKGKECKYLAGENLYMGAGGATLDEAGAKAELEKEASGVDDWCAEKSDYTESSNTCATGKKCGHFTQVVWDVTAEVGCGAKVNYDDAGGYSHGLICVYGAGGNANGEKPYVEGRTPFADNMMCGQNAKDSCSVSGKHFEAPPVTATATGTVTSTGEAKVIGTPFTASNGAKCGRSTAEFTLESAYFAEQLSNLPADWHDSVKKELASVLAGGYQEVYVMCSNKCWAKYAGSKDGSAVTDASIAKIKTGGDGCCPFLEDKDSPNHDPKYVCDCPKEVREHLPASTRATLGEATTTTTTGESVPMTG